MDMDEDVQRLLREERVVAAAELASRRGDAHTASLLFERACDFRRAATEAERAGEFARSLQVALEGNDEATAERVLPHVAKDANEAERLAVQLEQRGHHGWAGRLFEGSGKCRAAAARAYERAGLVIKAADLFEAEGDVEAAARALQTQIRKSPDSFAVCVALGGLLLRYGKTEAAVRALQKVPEGSSERREALARLLVALDRLGLAEARLEAERELTSLGGALASPKEVKDVNATELHSRLFGRYEIVREVAASPSARLVECIDVVRRERVAVKIFAAYDARGAGRDALARFEREVRTTGTLDHPNIVPLLEYVAEGPAIVLAWMGRGTLEQMIARESLTPARAVEIADSVLAALGEAHRLGILHRDVKPANVLFDDAGTARLGDFGVAHLGDLSTTVTAGVIGTLGYMSPEQREGRQATARSDLYAVGVMLWEMLTGEHVEADFNACTSHVSPSAMHRDLSSKHDRIVFAMLAVDPTERPTDAFAARRALAALAWPNTVERAAHPKPAIARPKTTTRLQFGKGGIAIDQWLDRRVVTLPLDGVVLARASAFARADHPALQSVLRVDRESSTVWLEAPRGAPLIGKLDAARAATVREALAELHRVGEVHGHVDRDHVRIDDEGHVMLLFTKSADATRTIDIDRLDLERLT